MLGAWPPYTIYKEKKCTIEMTLRQQGSCFSVVRRTWGEIFILQRWVIDSPGQTALCRKEHWSREWWEICTTWLWAALHECGPTLQSQGRPEKLSDIFSNWNTSLAPLLRLCYTVPVLQVPLSQHWSLRLKVAATSSFSTRSQFKAPEKRKRYFKQKSLTKETQQKK